MSQKFTIASLTKLGLLAAYEYAKYLATKINREKSKSFIPWGQGRVGQRTWRGQNNSFEERSSVRREDKELVTEL